MKFIITGAAPRGEWRQLDADEMTRRVRHHQHKLQELAAARAGTGPPGLVFATIGLGVEAVVVTVRHAEDRQVTMDGPFPETKEVVGGFDIIEFASPGAAVEWATATPWHDSHVSEIRPVAEFWCRSGVVDRLRTMQFEGRPEAAARSSSARSDAAQVFLLTSVEDARVSATLHEPEARRLQRRLAVEYIGERSMLTREAGMWLGARLGPIAEASTVRWRDGKPSVSDGPCTRMPEVVAGVNIVACASHDEAIAWARRLAQHAGQAVEIRPVRGCWWYHRE